jgi:hypothetical protein
MHMSSMRGGESTAASCIFSRSACYGWISARDPDDDGTNRHVLGSINLPGALERTPHEGDI